MTRANKQNNQEEEKMKQAQMNKIIEVWQKNYKKKQKEQDNEIEIIDEPVSENPFYRPQVVNRKVADYGRKQAKIIRQEELDKPENKLLKTFELLKTGYIPEAKTLSKELTESEHHKYTCFLNYNLKKLKRVTRQRVEKVKEERKRQALIPVVTIDL